MKNKAIGNLRLTLFLFSRNPKSNPRGYMLFLVVSLLITLSGLLVAYAILAKLHTLSSKGTAIGSSGFYGAEGALNMRVEELREVFLSDRNPSGTSPSSLDQCLQQSNLGTGDFRCKVASFASPDDATANILAYSYVVPENNGVATQGTVPPGDTFQGLNMLESRYAISAVSAKEGASPDEVIAMTEMVVKSRQIPMFQFAAFYANDLEILPGARMDLEGPVHTNGDLFLGANNNAPNGLTITGQVTVGNQLFNHRKNDNSTYPDGRVRIANGAGTLINLLSGGTGGTTQTTAAMNPANVNASWGSQVQLGVEALSIPTISTLGVGGNYAQQADINFVYAPEKTGVNVPGIGTTIIPFDVTATKRDALGAGTSTTLTNAQLASLRQPVLATGAAVTAGVCTRVGSSLTPAQIATLPTGLSDTLRIAILSQTIPVPFSATNVRFSDIDPLNLNANTTALTGIRNILFGTLNTAQQTLILPLTPNQIADLAGGCFISAPIQYRDPAATGYTATGLSFVNNRERDGGNPRTMRLLQINLESLTVWNFQGWYLDNAGTGLISANQLLFTTATADNAAPLNSFQNLGLAASDTSSNGLVFHATVSASATPNPNTNASPYGFVLVGGRQLPGLAETTNNFDPTGLTFVSDQAVYVVGNYNTVNWQPASVLADSLNVLSRLRLNNDFQLNKASLTTAPVSEDTTVNTAFLAGTDITNSTLTPGYNGGLENYPRFHENWGGRTLTYRGSFVSTGLPERVTGRWSNQVYGAPNRDWRYDTRFNNAKNLPPLSPRFVFLKQEGFSRNFDQ
ncbi:slr2018 [Synechocystis sp. PCC 6803]|uniref:Slr2018 protein n=2 Tax=Synechocystis TaxID=1142 RepID=P73238_SYNY3|nr:hypothetical protein [Synechocystis sp. FACHB-908]AGF50954.1 hypothetical protein MYO_16960 [Synechocystis sp. PCC 6803]AVP88843.1 hypothetical protein C7I86_03565 [Synechocystis sp. IPPAS B-1465]MBD2617357.1 hypothetical protein [Synechocystis sp. FACHB-898]MBD2659920.1 hypothetical protein [Synechocystis sp. FACHB-929]BAL28437.1 hypothetical protein SYNGTI_0690 [Synechocystis sp. PCC 6803 substr. GT-I]BAL31606.1 hypothetical protein SYNPCCN_0689 [Synechocystis sp. PCC 6803 substr. PCC-N]